MLARARGVPMLIGLGDDLIAGAADALAVLDAHAGEFVHPDARRLQEVNERLEHLQARASADPLSGRRRARRRARAPRS